MFEIFKRFFLLGWVSFGGPAAHIGYFRNEFVQKRGWISEEEYAQLIALSQFLPGPGSSQVGFALGYHRKGLLGALLASISFTLPSILIMVLLANISHSFFGNAVFEGVIHGLKLLAVVVVADAIMGMYKSFCKDKLTILLCIMTATLLLVVPSITTQLIALLIAALIGRSYLKSDDKEQIEQDSKGINWLPLIIFALCFFVLPAVISHSPLLGLFSDFFQAGSLVFGGGHVVLPLLQNIVGDQVSTDSFLTGYAAAQAVPGPMFTFATFLGYELWSEQPVLGALVATVAIFLPGFLLVLGVFNHWQVLAKKPALSGAIVGINAAVVGLLISALYDPSVSPFKDIFGVEESEHNTIRDNGKFTVLNGTHFGNQKRLLNCGQQLKNSLNANKKYIWVEGSCEITSSQYQGFAEAMNNQPDGSFIIVHDGSLSIMGAPSGVIAKEMKGIILHFNHDYDVLSDGLNWSGTDAYGHLYPHGGVENVLFPSSFLSTASFYQHGAFSLNGGLFFDTEGQTAIFYTSANFKYNSDIVQKLISEVAPPRWQEGSWHDF